MFSGGMLTSGDVGLSRPNKTPSSQRLQRNNLLWPPRPQNPHPLPLFPTHLHRPTIPILWFRRRPHPHLEPGRFPRPCHGRGRLAEKTEGAPRARGGGGGGGVSELGEGEGGEGGEESG